MIVTAREHCNKWRGCFSCGILWVALFLSLAVILIATLGATLGVHNQPAYWLSLSVASFPGLPHWTVGRPGNKATFLVCVQINSHFVLLRLYGLHDCTSSVLLCYTYTYIYCFGYNIIVHALDSWWVFVLNHIVYWFVVIWSYYRIISHQSV